MPKYSAKIYASALVELILKKKEGQVKKNIAGFLDFLAKKGDMKKAGEIIVLAESLYYKKTGKRKIILETARKIERKNILKDFFQDGDMVKEKVNSKLIAGIKLIVNNEKQIDFSLQKKLNEIFS